VEYRPGGHDACRPSKARSPSVTSTITAGGIDARELLSRAGCVAALEDVASLDGNRARAATAAVAMLIPPMNHGARVGEESRFLVRQIAGDEAQIVKLELGGERGRPLAAQAHREAHATAELAEQDEIEAADIAEGLSPGNEVRAYIAG
jgi:hypothetical protein